MLRLVYISTCLIVLISTCLPAQSSADRPGTIYRPKAGKNGAVVSAEPYASEAGLAVLEKGGNAIDASVTVGFCLAVTLPEAGNIGGGGFLIYHDASDANSYALDYRETAPMSAHRDMFLDKDGNADPEISQYSPLACGVPGTVAGLLEAHERFGTFPLKELLAPAIRMAREGVPVHEGLLQQLQIVAESDRLSPVAKDVYLGKSRRVPELGEIFKQPELADTLENISRYGRKGFYEGPVAEDIVNTLNECGKAMSLQDLKDYNPVWRKPVTGSYKGHQIVSMPPPSSGGVHLIQMLQLLENFSLGESGHNSTRTTYLMIEVMKRAYADRSKYLGDPDFTDVPIEQLLSEAYEKNVISQIDEEAFHPVPSTDIHPGTLASLKESTETTQFSIVDRFGNAVSNTCTLNLAFGSGIMTHHTGILMNNEMDDFSAKPGVPNAYGLIGGRANAVEPGKRPLSSMTPTIILKDGSVYAVTGSPGGSRIINTVLQVVLNLIDFNMNAAEANNMPRFHHQWLPDVIRLEKGFPVDTIKALETMGYATDFSFTIGAAQTIVRDKDGSLTASSDPRRLGGTALTY